MIRRIGASMIEAGRAARELWLVYVSTIVGLLRARRPRGEIARQMFAIGNRSLIFVGPNGENAIASLNVVSSPDLPKK